MKTKHAVHAAVLGRPSVAIAGTAKIAATAALTDVGITCALDFNGFVDSQAIAAG